MKQTVKKKYRKVQLSFHHCYKRGSIRFQTVLPLYTRVV